MEYVRKKLSELKPYENMPGYMLMTVSPVQIPKNEKSSTV